MPKAQKPPKPKPQQLLVEGKNDRHVIWALCDRHQLPEEFSVEVPMEEEGQGISVLLAGLPNRLNRSSPSQSPNPYLASFAADTRYADGTGDRRAGTELRLCDRT